MNVAPEIKFHGVERSPWIEAYVNERLEKLERLAQGITSAHVTLTGEQSSRHKGNLYSVMVELHLPPNHELAAKKERIVGNMRTQLRPLIRQAFEAIERQLSEAAEKRRYEVKAHDEEPRGMVEKLHPEGYGFIRAIDTDVQYYFHRNSVLHDEFDRLAVGTEVRFTPEDGEQGPQASSVQIVSKPGEHASRPL